MRYIVITVPKQVAKTKRNSKRINSIFLFKLHEKHSIAIKMKLSLTFIFSVEILAHSQYVSNEYNKNGSGIVIQSFYNIACYGNQNYAIVFISNFLG